jgi:hypothetical protein
MKRRAIARDNGLEINVSLYYFANGTRHTLKDVDAMGAAFFTSASPTGEPG